ESVSSAQKPKRAPVPSPVREEGKSLLPFTRVQKIIRADKDIPIMAREAVFLISVATEFFIQRLSEAAFRTAERERRSTVQHKDLATVVRKADEFLFLNEIIQGAAGETALGPKRKPKAATSKPSGVAPTMLDQFVATSKEEEATIVQNED
ncbi:hypothetical protein C8J56DRAFT_722444, partial [Mycena floridula]